MSEGHNNAMRDKRLLTIFRGRENVETNLSKMFIELETKFIGSGEVNKFGGICTESGHFQFQFKNINKSSCSSNYLGT